MGLARPPGRAAALYLPVIGYLLVRAVGARGSVGRGPWSGSSCSGSASGRSTEYLLHRFVFHLEPDSRWGRRLHFIIHGVHHDFPHDPMRLVMPPSVSIPLAIAFWFGFRRGARARPGRCRRSPASCSAT